MANGLIRCQQQQRQHRRRRRPRRRKHDKNNHEEDQHEQQEEHYYCREDDDNGTTSNVGMSSLTFKKGDDAMHHNAVEFGSNDGSSILVVEEEEAQYNVKDDNNNNRTIHDGDCPEEYLDLVQILTVLLLPTIARACEEQKHGNRPKRQFQPPVLQDDGGCWLWKPIKYISWMITKYRLQKEQRLYESLRPKPVGALTSHVRKVLLDQLVQVHHKQQQQEEEHDEDDEYYCDYDHFEMNESLVEQLLIRYGEVERAQNRTLVREMVQVAKESKSSRGLFDDLAFANALSADLEDWDIESEDRLSSMMYDVFGTSDALSVTSLAADDDATTSPISSSSSSSLSDGKNCGSRMNPLYDEEGTNIPSRKKASCYACYAATKMWHGLSEKCVTTRKRIVSSCCEPCRCCWRVWRRFVAPEGKVFQNECYEIDMVVDAHASVWVMTVVWVFYFVTALMYGALIMSTVNSGKVCRFNEFWCLTIEAIFSWGVFAAVLSLLGIVVILPLGYGNHTSRKHPGRQITAIIVTIIYSVVPFAAVNYYERSVTGSSRRRAAVAVAALIRSGTNTDHNNKVAATTTTTLLPDRSLETATDMVSNKFWDPLQYVVLLVGGYLTVLFILLILYKLLRSLCNRINSNTFKWFVSTSNDRAETRLKRAATRKINSMLTNAYNLHQHHHHHDHTNNAAEAAAAQVPDATNQSNVVVPTSSTSRPGGGATTSSSSADLSPEEQQRLQQTPMSNFVLRGDRSVVAGGFFWTWWRILNGTLFDTEGIWINSRMIVFQTTQIVVLTVVSLLLIRQTQYWAEQAAEARNDLGQYTPEWVFDMVPTPEMIYTSSYPAIAAAMLVMLLLILLYIPSAVATVLKYRCQLLPSLGSPYFNTYRTAVDSAYMNSANAVYGMVGSGVLFWILIGVLILLFQHPYTSDWMISLAAWCLGIGITVGLKMLLTMSCRSSQYRSLYRIRPGAASLSSLALECWHIGIGGSVLISRVVQFLFAAAYWVGRIDVPFLAEDVHILGYAFDYVPKNFAKDLLVHEAHRHPYLERLAQMYLMRLRNKNFGSNAGAAAWRQLCVLALFPWLAKYRVFNEERFRRAIEALEQRRKRRQEKDKEHLRYHQQRDDDDAAAATAGEADPVMAGVTSGFAKVKRGVSSVFSMRRLSTKNNASTRGDHDTSVAEFKSTGDIGSGYPQADRKDHCKGSAARRRRVCFNIDDNPTEYFDPSFGDTEDDDDNALSEFKSARDIESGSDNSNTQAEATDGSRFRHKGGATVEDHFTDAGTGVDHKLVNSHQGLSTDQYFDSATDDKMVDLADFTLTQNFGSYGSRMQMTKHFESIAARTGSEDFVDTQSGEASDSFLDSVG